MRSRTFILDRCYALLICFCFSFCCYGQTSTVHINTKADSLEILLHNARTVNDKIKLEYDIGVERNIYRIGYWDSIVNEAASHHLKATEVKALDRLGYCLKAHGDIAKAIGAYNRSIGIAEMNGLLQQKFYPVYHMAGLYFIQNDIKTSLEFCYSGLRIAEVLRDQQKIALSYILLGHIYFRSGQPEKAIKSHLYSLKISEQYDLHEEYTEALLGLGTDYRELKDTPNAIHYYMQTAKYVHEFGKSINAAGIYDGIGAAYELGHQIDSATDFYLKSYKISEKIGYASAMAGSMVLLAQNSFNKGNYKEAEQQALKALDIVRVANFKGQVPTLALLLVDIYERNGNYKRALDFFKLYTRTHDSVTNETIKQEGLDKQYRYDLEKKENANKFLAQQNQIQLLQISKGRYLMSGLIYSLLLLSIVSFLLIRQSKIKAGQQQIHLEQKVLRSQMNPHFIFNSLQAIQNFMLKQDEKKTAKYLSSFAELTRHVLESSRLEFITLSKEVTLLNKYLELQKLRFGNRFDYYIHIDGKIEEDLVMIPPMLCQPFIENAVEHGMRDVDSGGMIKVSYCMLDDMLHIEITDNGSGMDMNDHDRETQQSFAIEITKERIELMNKKSSRKCKFEISEAFPSQDGHKGVKVSFNVPLIFTA